MAITVTDKTPTNAGGAAIVMGTRRQVIKDVLLDNSYPAGGYAISLQQLGFNQDIDYVAPVFATKADFTVPLLLQWDYTNKKLLAYVWTTGVQVAGAVDLSLYTARIVAQGQ